ncbi:MAG: oxygenase MpaB family protein [Chitinophagales bacterium]
MQFPTPEYRQMCDAPADQLVHQLFAKYDDKTVRQIYLQLIHTFSEIDIQNLPKEIMNFHYQNIQRVKIEYPEKIQLSSEYFQHFGHSMFLMLICKSLPQLYSSYKGTKVLYETGYLVGKDNNALVARRLMETAQFFIDIMSKDSFQPDKYGFFAATKVRIIHAFVRKFMWDKNWNEKYAAEYDQPVCQEDMMGTLLAFSVCNIEGIQKMGLLITEEEKDAIIYTWHITGKLLGVDEEYNPSNFIDGQMLFHHLIHKEKKLGMENKALVDAILNFMRSIFTPTLLSKLPLKIKDQNKLPEILVSYFVGREISPFIGLTYHDDWYYKNILKSVAIILPNIFIQSRKSDMAENSVTQVSGFLVAKIFQFIKDEYKLEFRIQDEILKDWQLKPYLKNYGLVSA